MSSVGKAGAGSAGLGDLAGLQAARADVDTTWRTGIVDADALKVGIKTAIGGNHRVAAAVAEGGTLQADVANF
jgi:hypothetical protein